MRIADPEGNILFKATTDGKKIALVDYVSAGDKGESYTTWLTVTGKE